MYKRNIFRRVVFAALLTGICLCVLPGCINFNHPDCPEVPEDAVFTMFGQDVEITRNLIGEYKMVLEMGSSQIFWKSDLDNQTGYIYNYCFAELWLERFWLDLPPKKWTHS